MLGFAPLTRDLVADEQGSPQTLELTLLPFDEIKRIARQRRLSAPSPIAPAAASAPKRRTMPSGSILNWSVRPRKDSS